jgi:hypothetical protein
MVTTVRAKIREEDGHQVIVLPDGIRFDVPEVIVRRDEETGDLTVSSQGRPQTASELFAAIDARGPIPDDEWDEYLARRRESRVSRPDRDPFASEDPY